MKRKRIIEDGFTLAEVLVTLFIVGVLAAMTIPSLLNNIQNLMYKSSWKKEYSVISQAYKSFRQDNDQNTYFYRFLDIDNINKYFVVNKYCGSSSGVYVPNNCWPRNWKFLNGDYIGTTEGTFFSNFGTLGGSDCTAKINGSTLASGTNGTGGDCNAAAILNDGASIILGSHYSPSGSDIKIATLFVDVNGLKEPNTQGRDIYAMYLIQDSKGSYALPMGSVADWMLTPSVCASSGDGLSCSAEYIKQ